MKRNLPHISLVVALMAVFTVSVALAGGKPCACLDSIYDKVKQQVPDERDSKEGHCGNHPSPSPSKDRDCPCQNNSCTFFLEKKKVDFALVHADGSQMYQVAAPIEEKVFVSNSFKEMAPSVYGPPFIYLHLKSLRC